ncbi:ABC transporter permease [Proteinivorax tanatarense]|uniref:ABC transporter permease n=1 Tax=Proteinivorax tanatarense TaxID=1260629 RepID=A0AAU7VQ33_9FIRM
MNVIDDGQLQHYQHFEGDIDSVYLGDDFKPPSAMDYYGITMLIMTLMWGSLYANENMQEIKNETMGSRLRTSPIKDIEIISGKLLATLLTLMVQGTIIIIFTKFSFGVNWGDNLHMIFVTMLFFSIMTISLGILNFFMAAKDGGASPVTFLNLFVIVSTSLSGGFIPIQNPGGILSFMRVLSPNYYGQNLLFESIYSPNPYYLRSFVGLLIITAVFITLALIAKKRRELK